MLWIPFKLFLRLKAVFFLLSVYSLSLSYSFSITSDENKTLLESTKNINHFYGDFSIGAGLYTIEELSTYWQQISESKYDLNSYEYSTWVGSGAMGYQGNGFDINGFYGGFARKKGCDEEKEIRNTKTKSGLMASYQFLFYKDLQLKFDAEYFLYREKYVEGKKSLIGSTLSFESSEKDETKNNGLQETTGIIFSPKNFRFDFFAGPIWERDQITNKEKWSENYYIRAAWFSRLGFPNGALWYVPYSSIEKNYFIQNESLGLMFFWNHHLTFDFSLGTEYSSFIINYTILPFSDMYIKFLHESHFQNDYIQIGFRIRFSGMGMPDMQYNDNE